MSKFHFKKQIARCVSTGREVSFEWSHHRISSADSKVRVTSQNSIKHSGSERDRDPHIPVHRHRRSWQGSLALFPSCRKRWYSSWFRDPYASRGTEDSWPPSRKFPFVWIHQQRRWFFPCHQILTETSWPVRTEKSILGKRFIHSLRGNMWQAFERKREEEEAPLLPRARSRTQNSLPLLFRTPATHANIFTTSFKCNIYFFFLFFFCSRFFLVSLWK